MKCSQCFAQSERNQTRGRNGQNHLQGFVLECRQTKDGKYNQRRGVDAKPAAATSSSFMRYCSICGSMINSLVYFCGCRSIHSYKDIMYFFFWCSLYRQEWRETWNRTQKYKRDSSPWITPLPSLRSTRGAHSTVSDTIQGLRAFGSISKYQHSQRRGQRKLAMIRGSRESGKERMNEREGRGSRVFTAGTEEMVGEGRVD